MRCAGVTSKAGCRALTPAGATGRPAKAVTSSLERSSMGIAPPSGQSISTVLQGAATKNGSPCARASTARPYVPTLLATSPLRATRSAPTTTAPTSPRAIRCPAMPSVMSSTSMPSRASSHAVSRAPCKYGRVSSASTRLSLPPAHAARKTPSAVP